MGASHPIHSPLWNGHGSHPYTDERQRPAQVERTGHRQPDARARLSAAIYNVHVKESLGRQNINKVQKESRWETREIRGSEGRLGSHQLFSWDQSVWEVISGSRPVSWMKRTLQEVLHI